ncbi:hypothetical protein FQA39_LY01117 [Lamprigera yunnana]|nr:hypothetical protein FQA39_LY01117 [Lamprigera yunnana]
MSLLDYSVVGFHINKLRLIQESLDIKHTSKKESAKTKENKDVKTTVKDTKTNVTVKNGHKEDKLSKNKQTGINKIEENKKIPEHQSVGKKKSKEVHIEQKALQDKIEEDKGSSKKPLVAKQKKVEDKKSLITEKQIDVKNRSEAHKESINKQNKVNDKKEVPNKSPDLKSTSKENIQQSVKKQNNAESKNELIKNPGQAKEEEIEKTKKEEIISTPLIVQNKIEHKKVLNNEKNKKEKLINEPSVLKDQINNSKELIDKHTVVKHKKVEDKKEFLPQPSLVENKPIDINKVLINQPIILRNKIENKGPVVKEKNLKNKQTEVNKKENKVAEDTKLIKKEPVIKETKVENIQTKTLISQPVILEDKVNDEKLINKKPVTREKKVDNKQIENSQPIILNNKVEEDTKVIDKEPIVKDKKFENKQIAINNKELFISQPINLKDKVAEGTKLIDKEPVVKEKKVENKQIAVNKKEVFISQPIILKDKVVEDTKLIDKEPVVKEKKVENKQIAVNKKEVFTSQPIILKDKVAEDTKLIDKEPVVKEKKVENKQIAINKKEVFITQPIILIDKVVEDTKFCDKDPIVKEKKVENKHTEKNKNEEVISKSENLELINEKPIIKENKGEDKRISEQTDSKHKIEDIKELTDEQVIIKQATKLEDKPIENIKSKELTIKTEVPENNKKEELFSKVSKESTDKGPIIDDKKQIINQLEENKASASEMKEITHVRVLTLNDKEHSNTILYRMKKNWILQFHIGTSLFGCKVSLYCNYPETKDGKLAKFNINRYYLLPFRQYEGWNNTDDTALCAEINIKVSGSFHYYFVYENATEPCPQGSGYFLVDPVLTYGDDEVLPLDCIQCQTVLSKCLGPFSSWENKLRVAKESGYNMIHFTPVQELGSSNSAYSISEQLKLNPLFNCDNKITTFNDIKNLTHKMRKEWKMLSICDIVLNHTANETSWLEDHPESTYNCLNCPYMRPAYLLDAALHQFSVDVSKGFYETEGVPNKICNQEHLNAIRHALHTKVLPKIKLTEMFICDVNKLVSNFLDRARKNPSTTQNRNPSRQLKLIRDPLYRRLLANVDMELALQLYNVYRLDTFDEDSRLKVCGQEFKNRLDQLNNEIIDELNNHTNAAIENFLAGVSYFRVKEDGPKLIEVTLKNPLSPRYFTDYGNPKSLEEFESIMYGPNSKYLMAHNGWVMNGDPMKNFADADSKVYIRRELIAWGDSVKLRFGDKPEDSPFLWNHMKQYVEKTAEVFDGIRLDNCHSTPIPANCARKVRPELYVVAELFTNSDHTDNIFVNRLGITSLIREAMSAWDSHEEGRLVYRYGGEPVGAFYQPLFRPLVPSIAHALFLDLTHDNPSPVEKRSVFDLLPSSALVNMACCASGSNRGYDELVNHHIHVVDEDREYTEWTNDTLTDQNPQYVSYKSGIISAKKALNDLHFKLGKENFNQVYVDQVDTDIVTVTRHCPETHQSVILVAFTAFRHPNSGDAISQRNIKSLTVEGVLDEIILEATLNHASSSQSQESKYTQPEKFTKNSKWINGLSEYHVDIKQHIQLVNSDVFELGNNDDPNILQLDFKNFKPGSVVAIKVSLQKDVDASIKKLRKLMTFSRQSANNLQQIVEKLSLSDLNRVLYHCDAEERDEGKGFGTYDIPNFGPLVYCGFQGFMSALSIIRPNNDLGHPMCKNLRDGNWMIDYISQRLQVDDGTKELSQWIESNFKSLKSIPRYLVPSYFDVLITGLYMLLLDHSYSLMSNFVKNGSVFVKMLSLGTIQLAAVIKSAKLPILSPNLAAPRPPVKDGHQTCVILSAGLPHFSVGYMRSWGRDTFIALRGLFILTGRYEDARYHILGFAASLRHGLIPNLLDGGNNSRYNCRDALWWWLQCIKCYVEEVPGGINILSDKVSRIYPTDDSSPQEAGKHDQALCDVMQEALKVHFQGLCFRERNAGRQIDAHMSDDGFNVQIGIHPETGFVFGGNESNCGTWMDKMGSSDTAGNRGKPGTPRDGSAVELIGLSKCVITWLATLSEKNQYPYEGVERTTKSGTILFWSFKKWSEKIMNNFEKCFWIDTNKTENEKRPDLVNKRGIYKDCFGASQEWTDFQLRCNFPIAMVVAPELFDPKHAWIALEKAEKYLLGPLGMKTLDPEDWAYNGDYNNSDDSNNFTTAHGFNYHQGPEWLWPVGFFLRAKLKFAEENGYLTKTVARVKVILSKHFRELQTGAWRGLPELTNSNGTYCEGSCRTQAWNEISPVEEQDVSVSENYNSNNTEQHDSDVVVLKPLLLNNLRRTSLEKKMQLKEFEYKKSVRIVIIYTFAFCGLAITTFFIIYLL